MLITVTGRHVTVSDEVRQHAENKAGKLPRYYDRIQAIDIVLGHESEQFSAEMIVRADGGGPFIAKEIGPDTFVLIDQLVERLERQLTKHKEQRRSH